MELERAKIEMVKTGCRDVIFAIETGRHYWHNPTYFLLAAIIPLMG